ncbi:MAG: Glycosyltransferase [Phormidesmis priestleyi Ana]|uniref:Glycosyltransferase n=1 Tax=Phormidesmis priestleyi Ana TaxID=1666911 RepID=A0A0P8C3W9_9CYAN|nr:MAG: Glycosyltransferase [Phormidesmis priestleyi Ana]
MKILFLDQSGQLGGAELCLIGLAKHYGNDCLVGLFAPGPFSQQLAAQQIPVEVLAAQPLNFQKQSGTLQAMKSLGQLWPLVQRVSRLSREYDCIYANTQKALVVGAIASRLSGKPLVYHLHDIISSEHFSRFGQQVIVTLANQAALVIANSLASQSAFIAAGGRAEITEVVYNGFDLAKYSAGEMAIAPPHSLKYDRLGAGDGFVVGHFSRLSPWKGQHVLIDALQHCPPQIKIVLVGSALFGEESYVQQLHTQIERLGLGDRVQFLGFRADIPAIMSACDLIAHTSTAAEPFGRVIVEGMLCDRPVVAAAAGGAVEIVRHSQTGWLTPPGDARKLAEIITTVYEQPERAKAIAQRGQQEAQKRFDLKTINPQIDTLLSAVVA